MRKFIPSSALFVYMYVRKEALLSSQIEGTQSSFSDLILFENNQKPNIDIQDVEEVSNYVKAITHGINRLKSNFPLSLRLIKEIHEILLSGSRGSQMMPGEFRKSQNWIGGTRPGNAIYVPPSVDMLKSCLSNFELFLHDETLPVLIKAGIAHVQFESIHPFLDGNGRLGRLLISLILYNSGMLDEPILYISLFLKENRQTYYNLLQEVRTHGTWNTWLEFFLDGIASTASSAIRVTQEINDLFLRDEKTIHTFGRARFACLDTLEVLKKLPQITSTQLMKMLDISAPTARSALSLLCKSNIITEVTNSARNKIYVYKNYLDFLQDGAEPLKQ